MHLSPPPLTQNLHAVVMSFKGLKRDLTIADDKGRKLNALLVFSMSIRYLKDHVVHTLSNRTSGVTEKDVHWVLTVPAIWNDNAKQFMREAAEKVQLHRFR